MECEECKKKVKVCYRSDNQRYKLYVCKECKSKETTNAEKANLNSPKEVKRKVSGNAGSNHVEHVGASEGDSYSKQETNK